ncbi:MAG: hypothetical protein GY838_15085 [bacterium]|nr:hypothetical protein [bacterium]
MKRTILCLVLLVVAAQSALAQLPQLHVPAPASWTAVDQEYRFGRDSLWEYINGAAELFLTYRFSELVVADFELGDAALTVSVYDMGGKLDAYGVYETEKPRDAELLADAGAAAVLQPPYQGLFIKDRFYVKIEAGGGDVTAEVLGAAMRDVAAALPGDDSLPPELSALPETGRVPGTVAFAGSDFLGFEDLKGCLYADYRGEDGAEYRLFVMTPSAEFLGNADGKWERSEADGRLRFSRSIPYRGVVVLVGGEDRLVGVSGPTEIEAATKLLSRHVR